MFDVVVQGIAVGNIFQSHVPGPPDDLSIGWLEIAIGAPVGLLQLFYKGVN
jgi:hypothetical protein